MPAFLAPLAARVGASIAARGGVSAVAQSAGKSLARGAIMRSAMSTGHGVSATQFAPQPAGIEELDVDKSNW